MREILLVDMNAFFIMCESKRDKSLIDAPAAVAGDPRYRTGIILAANYKAREYSVKVAMTVTEALRLCPHLKLVKPDHVYYEQCSKEVFSLLQDYTPVIEINSIDEAWLDVTNSIGLFGDADKIAENIQLRIKDELGLWCSIGISENKFLSKMASDFKKPLGITSMYKKDISDMLWPLSTNRMYGVGKVTSNKLSSMNINTIGDIAKQDVSFLVSKFGKNGVYMYEKSNGIDHDPVGREDPKNPSCGRMVTLEQDITDVSHAKKAIAPLCDDIARTIRSKDQAGSVVSINLKYDTFHMITRQMKIHETNSSKEIYNTACALLEMNWDSDKPVRLVGVTIGMLATKSTQLEFDFDDIKKQEDLECAIDVLKDRFSEDIIKRGNVL